MIRQQTNALQTSTHLSELALYTEETRVTISYQHRAKVTMAHLLSLAQPLAVPSATQLKEVNGSM